jgi:hypothetical protein
MKLMNNEAGPLLKKKDNELQSAFIGSNNLFDIIKYAFNKCENNIKLNKKTIILQSLIVNIYCNDLIFAENFLKNIVSSKYILRSFQKEVDIYVISPIDGILTAPPFWGTEIHSTRFLENLLKDTPFHASYFHDLALWHLFDSERSVGLQWMQAPDAYPAWEAAGPLRIFMHWALATQHSRLVHAGTLGKNGNGVLFAGRGGAGKSSTVVAGIKSGLQSAGDDYVHVCAENGGFSAYPVFSTLKQDEAGLKRLGLQNIAALKSVNWQNKYEFTAQDIDGLPLTGPLKIKAIVVPVIADQEHTDISPASKSQAMLALAPSALFQMPGERDSGVAFFANLVRALPCIKMTLGRNPSKIINALNNILDV